ncbi:Zn-ribbon domain-containing OB-fold protein [Methylocapsa sp. S129]|uniref:Zn-ribbon domain-containing OB-fold protein n=1 Tax=Methylocapsa sp. S129 TaxID=1641869 RepID=UPI00131CD4FE|nr:OB-fold domain-containing protein [Methylocapsa sp. S129]
MANTASHPNPTAWSAPFWEAAAQRRLVIQHCRSCDASIMYPKRVCPHCLGEDLGWRASKGEGEIYSVTVQKAAPPTGFEDRLPYVIAIVRLDEDVQLMTNLIGSDAEHAECGDRVTVDFETRSDIGVTLPVFRLVNPK